MANKGLIKLEGFKELEAALLKLPKELSDIVEKDVVRAGMKPVQKAAKANLAGLKGEGLLAKSIGLNVRRIRKKGNTVNRYTARVGARTGFKKMVRVSVSTKDRFGKLRSGRVYKYRSVGQSYSVYKDPTKYAHLVEYGTSHSAAHPFIRPAIESTQSQILIEMAKGYEKGIDKIIKKIRSNK